MAESAKVESLVRVDDGRIDESVGSDHCRVCDIVMTRNIVDYRMKIDSCILQVCAMFVRTLKPEGRSQSQARQRIFVALTCGWESGHHT